MEVLDGQPMERDGGVMKEGRGESEEQCREGTEASSPIGSSTDDETDEDSETEPQPVVRRKVSFADAFGLNLVSVKEFDHVEVAESEASPSEEMTVIPIVEDFYVSCLFSVPSSTEELEERLQVQMVELESIELLPGTTTIRGMVRVVNLCFSKCVYARLTLDRWESHFDLLAEYVPGSSDRRTDRFSFKYTMVPPFERDGTRVEFCLRYETSAGTFWANNKHMNYVLFCHQKAQTNKPQMPEEIPSYKTKRSCLKANRSESANKRTLETMITANNPTGPERTQKPGNGFRKTAGSAGIDSLLHDTDYKSLVESVKSRHKATRLAHVQDYLSQRRHQVPAAFPHDSGNGQKASKSLAAPLGGAASFLDKCQKTQPSESPQVLTYHQIPLLTLDWNNDNPQQWGAADVDDIWTGEAKMTLSKASKENRPSVNDMWENFLNGTDDSADKEISVCDVWQAFLNGPGCKDHSAIPESEWLQTATSVSPSHDKEPRAQYAASSQEFPEFQGETPVTLRGHTSAACQRLSDSCETLLANLASNAEDQQPDVACVSSPRHDNAATRAASQRSLTNSETDTPQEFSLEGATPVSERTVDCSTECHTHAVREPERGGIIGGAEGTGGDEPFTSHVADFVTSSGESETTDLTAMPQSQNANAVDRISQGARLHEGLSSSGKGEVTATAHNAAADMLAFRETIRQEGKDGARQVVSASRQGVQDGMTMDPEENKVCLDDEGFRPEEECEVSLRHADELHCEEFSMTPSNEAPLHRTDSDENTIRSAPSNTGESESRQISTNNFNPNVVVTSVNGDVSTNNQEKEFKQTEEEKSNSNTWKQEESLRSEDGKIAQVLDKHITLHQTLTTDEHLLLTGKEECTNYDEEIKDHWDSNTPVQIISTTSSSEMKHAFQKAHDTCRDYPTDEPKPLEVTGPRWTHSQEEIKGQKEDIESEINAGDVAAKRNDARRDTSDNHPEKPARVEEDVSQKDESTSVGKLKTDTVSELTGNVEGPQGKRKNPPDELKEPKLSAKVEGCPLVEYNRLSDGTKDGAAAENTTSLEALEPRLEEMFIERFAEDLIWGILEEVFNQMLQASNKDRGVDRASPRRTDTTLNCPPLVGEDVDDTFDSGVFSFIELLEDPEQARATQGNESSPESLTAADVLSKLQSDFNSSNSPSDNVSSTLTRRSCRPLTESIQAFGSVEKYPQARERAVPCQEEEGQTEVRLNETLRPIAKRWSASQEKLNESHGRSWRSVLFIISHIIRLLICILLVGGFFFVVFLYDFPAFFGLYIFSLCWWFYKWRRYRVTTKSGIVR